jgi:hypothetical protein
LRSRLRTSRIVALFRVIYGFLSLQRYCFWVAYYWRIEYTTTIVVIDATVKYSAIVKILTTTTKRAKYHYYSSYTTTVSNPLDKWGVPGKGL